MEWIKCSDQMPPEDKVNVFPALTWDGEIVQSDWRWWDGLMHHFRWQKSICPTHWMPLPKPPVTD